MPAQKEQRSAVATLPNSVEAEQNVLCCIIKDQGVQLEIIAALRPEDFYQHNHFIIFEAMRRISEQTHKDTEGNTLTNTVTFTTLADELRRNGKLAEIGDIDYLLYLNDMLPSTANYQEYVSIVKRASTMRQMITICGEITKHCYSSDSAEEVITLAEERIFKLSQGDSQRDLVDLSSEVAHTLKKINDRYVNPGKFRGIETGFSTFDNMTNGLHGGELIVLAARPGGGKSAMAMNIVEHVALQGKTVAVYSLEMSNEQIIERLLSSMSGIPLSQIKSGSFRNGAADIVKLETVNNVLCNMKLFGNDYASIKPAEISSQCRRLKATQGLDMVVIDYIQLMNSDKENKDSTRQNEVANITRALKLMAKELNIPVLALSQLKREAETRNLQGKAQQQQSSEPVLSDLRESGAIEQDADIVLFVHGVTQKDNVDGDVSLVVAKHRNGSTGSIPLKWIGKLVRFVDPKDFEEALSPLANIPEEPEYGNDEAMLDGMVIASDESEEQQVIVDSDIGE